MIGIGLYRHYKGGLYRLLFCADTHRHNGDLDAVYVSLTHGTVVTRPMRRDSRQEDAWTDVVRWPDGIERDRFLYEEVFQMNARSVIENLESLWRQA